MTDTYSTERAGFAERLARLAGGTTWREPMTGHATDGDQLPESHALAAALAMARRSPNDIGPDIVYSLVCQRPTRRQAVVTELTAALLASTGRVGERCADVLPMMAAACYVSVCTGVPLPDRIEGATERDWLLVGNFGCGILWDAAEQSLRRAERVYRQAA